MTFVVSLLVDEFGDVLQVDANNELRRPNPTVAPA